MQSKFPFILIVIKILKSRNRLGKNSSKRQQKKSNEHFCDIIKMKSNRIRLIWIILISLAEIMFFRCENTEIHEIQSFTVQNEKHFCKVKVMINSLGNGYLTIKGKETDRHTVHSPSYQIFSDIGQISKEQKQWNSLRAYLKSCSSGSFKDFSDTFLCFGRTF